MAKKNKIIKANSSKIGRSLLIILIVMLIFIAFLVIRMLLNIQDYFP